VELGRLLSERKARAASTISNALLAVRNGIREEFGSVVAFGMDSEWIHCCAIRCRYLVFVKMLLKKGFSFARIFIGPLVSTVI
jgi:hypothetical protein